MNPTHDIQLNALGDPTRRAILAQLLDGGPTAVGRLAESFPVSRPAISQHLRILKEARLVFDRQSGNRRFYQLDPYGFAFLREYFDKFWTTALDAFKRRAEAADEEEQA